MQGARVQSLGQEDPLEKAMAPHSQYSCLENPMDGGASVHRVTNSQTGLSDFTFFSLRSLVLWPCKHSKHLLKMCMARHHLVNETKSPHGQEVHQVILMHTEFENSCYTIILEQGQSHNLEIKLKRKIWQNSFDLYLETVFFTRENYNLFIQ